VKLNKDLKAPLKKGDEVGTLIIKKDGKVVTTSPLLAKDSMKEASWWNFFKRTFTTFTKTS
jgi:serine-type D-Ala-D-Ala carboxypeptidase (penicillin-binding protein 5/6)